MAHTFHCYDMLVLNPINDLTGNIYNERINKLMEVFESLPSHDAIHNVVSPQYKAACFILYDDVKEMKVEDELTIERCILYLFFLSTELFTWGQSLPSNFCDNNVVWCDHDGHILALDFCKSFMTLNSIYFIMQ